MSTPRNRLLARIIAPESEPLTLEEAKLYLRVDHDEDNMMIGDLIVVARMTAEDWMKRSLMTQTWKLAYDDYAPEMVGLPMGPVQEINSVVIVARDTTTQTVADTVYYLNAAMDTLMLDSTLFGFRVEINFVSGYGEADDVPMPIRQGMLAHIAAMYDYRGASGQMPLPDQTIRLYTPFREMRL